MDCPVLYVDNTNCAAWEIAPYYRLAEIYGCEVTIVNVICELKTAMKRGIHSVPFSTVLFMSQTMQNTILPAHWNQTVVFTD